MSHFQMAQALRQAKAKGQPQVYIATEPLRIPHTRTSSGYITKGSSVRVHPNGEVYWTANSGKEFVCFARHEDFLPDVGELL